jgi:hypothetical protein
VISGRRIFGPGYNSSRINSARINQVSTSRGGGSIEKFTMEGQDPIIRLPEFHGEGSEDPKKNIFICEKNWTAKHIIDKDTKVPQLSITFIDCALHRYMGLIVNNSIGAPTFVVEVKRKLINEFEKSSLEDQFMNEMIEIKKKLRESV